MEVIYLITIILAVALQNAVRKPYTVKTAGMGSVFYSGISALSAMIFFVITSGKLEWNPAFIPYSLGFGVYLPHVIVQPFLLLPTALFHSHLFLYHIHCSCQRHTDCSFLMNHWEKDCHTAWCCWRYHCFS